MAEQVQYEVSLKDLLSEGLMKAEGHAQKLEGALHNISHTGIHMLEGMGVAFATFKGFDFLEQSMHSFHKLHEQEALLENTLANVGERAHISGEEMISFAQKLHHQIPQNVEEIVSMEGAMSRFNITNKETFQKLINMSADVAVSLHRDSAEVAASLGMIMEKPAMAARRLREFKIILNSTQQQILAHLVATGQTAKAQEIIFDQLRKKGFEGAAATAAAADPLKKFHDLVYDIQLWIGKWGTILVQKLTPAMGGLINAVRDTIKWIREHKDLLLAIGTTISIVAIGWGIYTFWLGQAALWTKLAAAGQWLLNSALIANPIMLVVEAFALAVGAIIYFWNKSAGLRAFLYAMWGTIKEFGLIVTDVFVGLWHTIHGVFTFHPSEITKGWTQMTSAIADSGTRMAHAYKQGWDEGMADFAKDHEKTAAHMNLIVPPGKKTKGLADTGGFDDLKGKEKTSKASGQKNIKIDIKIGQLIGKYESHTTTINESIAKIKEHVTQAILSAVNDSQIVAGQ